LLRGLRGTLKSSWAFVVSLFSKLRSPRKKTENAILPKDNTRHKATNSPKADGVLITNAVPPPPAKEQTEKCRYPDTPWWKTAAELVGIAAVVAYAIITGFMWSDAHDNFKDAHENFKIDERAWVYVVMSGLQTDPPVTNAILQWNIDMKNTGKTTAKYLYFGFITEILDKNQEVSFDYAHTLAQTEQIPFIVPNGDAIVAVIQGDITGAGPKTFTQTDVDKLKAGNAYIVTYGKGTYQDIFGNQHWLTFCGSRGFATGYYPTKKCTYYNDTGDGGLPK
jgi:hypothetical protein